MAKREGGDPTFEWTPERIELAARADVMTRHVRLGNIEPEEALLLTVFGPTDERLKEMVEKEKSRLGLKQEGAEPREPVVRQSEADRRAKDRARERDRYHNDPEYHARRLASFRARRQDPAYREREAARKRAARARAKERRKS